MNLTIERAEQLQTELQNFGAAIVLPPRDSELALPHSDFLAQLFKWVKPSQPRYKKQAWDCDDFSMDMVTKASRRLAELGVSCGHSILYCTLVIIEGCELNAILGGSHSTCLVKTADRGWVFFEPQNGKITNAKEALADSVGSLDVVLL